jgi:ribosomal protein S18 acetylase RimI-like enzyme
MTTGAGCTPLPAIVRGSAADLDPFVDLLEAAAAWLWSRGIRQWEPGSMAGQRRTFARWTQAGGLVVARSEAGLAGGCFLVPEPGAGWAGHPGPALHLRKLAVARAHAGSGLSRRILAGCEERARNAGVPWLRLDCWDGSGPLRAFYRGAGFCELEAVPSGGYHVRLFERDLG